MRCPLFGSASRKLKPNDYDSVAIVNESEGNRAL
jgi:hypothetical protein